MSSYLRRSYRLPEDLEDEVTFELWSQSTLGVHVRPVEDGLLQVDAYYTLPHDIKDTLEDPRWQARGVEPVCEETLGDEDWLAGYRHKVRPFALGQRFWVDPREPQKPPPPSEPGRFLLRLPARRAFGTGSHESTRLVVQLLEGLDLRDQKVLDVGTGSGILAFVSLVLGARWAVGLDVDLAAALLAGENARLNQKTVPLVAAGLEALRLGPTFDLALVNVLPERILPQLPRLRQLLRPTGRTILSGVIEEQRATVVAQLRRLGWQTESTRRDGDWAAFLLRP